MRKMTPMILVILMLASVLSSIDVYELQEQNEFEETSARAGADPEVVYVTSPRETLIAPDGATTNELLAGQSVNFKAFIRNSGDADLTNMQYQVTVYDSVSGERGDVAKDVNGNDLAWSNDKAVCSNSCQNSVLTPGEFIDGGESTLVTTSGNVIQWIPMAGSYFVQVSVTSQVLGDPGNDEISYPVTVKDYHDIVVDLAWLDESGNEVSGGIDGVDPVEFKLTVDLTGSMSAMTLRNTTIALTVTGGTVDNSNYLVEILGEQRTVDISNDGEGNVDTSVRMLIGADETGQTTNAIVGERTMTLTPPTDGEYSVSVMIESYTLYGAEGCATVTSLCERTILGVDAEDEYSGNNMDTIAGSASTLHDITLFDYYLSPVVTNTGDEENQNDDSGITDRYGFMGGEISQTLPTGDYELVAVVMHSSSSLTPLYEWNVTFTVTDTETGTSTVVEALDCASQDYSTHKVLGIATDRTDAETVGTACATYFMGVGEYNIQAHVNMLGQVDDGDGSVDEKVVDMITINNMEDYTFTVDNFEPTIVSLRASNREVIAGDSVTITGNAFDVEGDRLNYMFYDGSGNQLGDTTCIEGTCTFTVSEADMPVLEVRMEVTDGYSTVDGTISLDVVVVKTFTASGLTDGFNSVYVAKLKTSSLDVTFADGPLDEVDISTCANSATPVGAVTFNPSTTYDSSVVLEQTIYVHFPNDLGVQYMWMESQNTVVEVASGAGQEIDASTSGYEYMFIAGADLPPAGTNFYLIAEDCETPDPPAGAITQLTASASMGGDIVISYNYDEMLSNENVKIEVTAADSSEPEITFTRVESDTRTITWSSGTDGMEYTISAQLCNEYACGQSVSATATSDASVAAVTATSVAISESGDNWVVTWQPSAIDEDVAGWYVCYDRGEFTASQMKILIDAGACKMVMDANEATIAKYTTVETTQVHFGIVPHDAVMNIAYGPSTDSILYDRAQDTTNPDDGTTTTDSEASSGVPTWTWGVIGAVVVVAFIVGAFILSRGEGEGDDDKEWDY